MGLGLADVFALALFLGVWAAQGWLTESSPWRARSLSHAMNEARAEWMRRMAERDLRMIDTAIMAGLQNGTAFFASTALLAIGGGFALLNASDRVMQVFADLPMIAPTSRALYEVKVLGFILIFAYAFFKFGWAYRLFNYASILMGAVPLRAEPPRPGLDAAVARAAGMTVIAGRHFNRGLRAFFMSLGYLGWFLGPWPLVATSTIVFLVLLRRQFLSDSHRILVKGTEP